MELKEKVDLLARYLIEPRDRNEIKYNVDRDIVMDEFSHRFHLFIGDYIIYHPQLEHNLKLTLTKVIIIHSHSYRNTCHMFQHLMMNLSKSAMGKKLSLQMN